MKIHLMICKEARYTGGDPGFLEGEIICIKVCVCGGGGLLCMNIHMICKEARYRPVNKRNMTRYKILTLHV